MLAAREDGDATARMAGAVSEIVSELREQYGIRARIAFFI